MIISKGYVILLLSILASAAGCVDNKPYMTEELRSKGLVVILPGIEGVSRYNRNIRSGLIKGGLKRAMLIQRWGHLPGIGALLNQMDVAGNRMEGVRIARQIMDYQNQYPGRSVWIVGHSGGAGVAVFTAEALPNGRKIDGLILLAASIHKEYNLTKALSHCQVGIVNFYNPGDKAMLQIGTTLVGNVDGRRGPSAGLEGFTVIKPLATAGGSLRQVRVTGGLDPHGRATDPSYVSANVVPYLKESKDPLAAAVNK
ncbi:MAG TPA: hypothetical protein ENL03_04595 [Phycisphaerae bacterium]|nr:hypothetical protein [Phycisphaerae bacterium]